MRLRARNFEQRVGRLRLRANAQPPAARLEAPVRPISAAPSARSPAPQAQPEADSRRRDRRLPLGSEISVRKAGSLGFQLPAIDLSAGGCRVELVEMVDVKDRIVIRLPSLEPLGAEVAWVRGNNAGLRFQRPLHPAVFDQLIKRFVTCAA